MKKVLPVILAVLLVFTSVPCLSEQVNNKVTIGINGTIDGFDPIKIATAEAQYMAGNIYEPLIRPDASGKLTVGTGLAETMDINDNHTEFTFHLRQNAKWSNGDSVTANDFVYAASRFLNPANAAPAAQQLLTIKNAYAVYLGQADISALGVQAIDDYTLVLTFETPVVNIEELTYQIVFLPQNQKFIEACGDSFASSADKCISCGPFVLSELSGVERAVFVKNADYWDASNVALEAVTYQSVPNSATRINMFATGELDIIRGDTSVSDQYAGKPEEHIISAANNMYLGINNQKVSNVNIRKAISMAINREALIKSVNPASTVPVGVANGSQNGAGGKDYQDTLNGTTYISYNVEEASKLFNEGLSELEMTSEQLGNSLTILCSIGFENIGIVIASQLESNLGLTVKIESVAYMDMQTKLLTGDYTLCPVQLSFNSDPLQPLSLFSSQSLYAFSFYSSADYDALYGQALMNGTDSRYDAIMQMEQMLFDNAVVIPLYNINTIAYVNTRIENAVIPVNMIMPDAKLLGVNK